MPIYKLSITTALCLLFLNIVNAQNEDAVNTYTPYSFYGVGDLAAPGFAYHRGMGGIGIGLQNNRTINYLNPAALSSQDTLSFLFDFGGEMQNYYLATSEHSSAYNSFNMHHIAMSFPVWHKMVFGLTVMPYSNVGYKVAQKETSLDIIGDAGDITYSNHGEGGLTQVIGSLGYSFGRLSVGGQVQYLFGSIDRYANVTLNTLSGAYNANSGKLIKASDMAFALGAQYTRPAGAYDLTLGAVYQFKNHINVDKLDFAYRVGSRGTDTVRYNEDNNAHILLPASIGVGFTLRNNTKWVIGADYVYRDWTNATFDIPATKEFKAMPEHIIRTGFEYTPNRNDIRYMLKRWSYRAGLFFENTYMQFDGNRIRNYGMTFGIGIPMGSQNNAINLAAEVGLRGTTGNGLIRERYWKVSVSMSLYDIWFVKRRFE